MTKPEIGRLYQWQPDVRNTADIAKENKDRVFKFTKVGPKLWAYEYLDENYSFEYDMEDYPDRFDYLIDVTKEIEIQDEVKELLK